MLGQFDWCDVRAVDQMAAYIRDEKGKLTAPEGAHDDLLMARMITGVVAHRERSRTDLFVDPFDRPYTFVTPTQRVAEMLRDKPLEEVEEF